VKGVLSRDSKDRKHLMTAYLLFQVTMMTEILILFMQWFTSWLWYEFWALWFPRHTTTLCMGRISEAGVGAQEWRSGYKWHGPLANSLSLGLGPRESEEVSSLWKLYFSSRFFRD